MTPLEALRASKTGGTTTTRPQTPLELLRASKVSSPITQTTQPTQTQTIDTASTSLTPLQKLRASLPPKEPTFVDKAVGFGKDVAASVIKPFARGATNVTQIAQTLTGQEKTTPFSGEFLGDVQPIGGTGEFNVKNVLDAIGTGADIASNIPFAGSASIGYNLLKNVGKEGAIKAIGKAALPIALEGATGGALAGFGKSAQEQAASPEELSASKLALDSALGAAIGTVAAPVLSGGFAVIGRLIRGKTPEIQKGIINELEKNYNVDLSSPESKYAKYLQEQGYEGYKAPTEVIDFGPVEKPKLPTVDISEPQLGQIPGMKYEPIVEGPVPTPENVPSKFITPEPAVSTGEAVIPETPKVELPAEKKAIVEKAAQDIEVDNEPFINKDLPIEQQIEQRQFRNQMNTEQLMKVASHDDNYIIDVALGRKAATDAPATAYMSYLKRVAQEAADNGDFTLAQELAGHPNAKTVTSLAGQELQAVKIAGKDNIVDMLNDISEQRMKKLPTQIQKNSKKIVENIKNSIDEMVTRISKEYPTRKEISDLLDGITCK